MAWYIVLGALAAFGGYCALWVAAGWLLPPAEGAVLVISGEPEEGLYLRVRWLQRMGFLRCPLLAVGKKAAKDRKREGIEYCSPEQLSARLEQERKYVDGTGNGNPAGRDQRRGI